MQRGGRLSELGCLGEVNATRPFGSERADEGIARAMSGDHLDRTGCLAGEAPSLGNDKPLAPQRDDDGAWTHRRHVGGAAA